MATGLLRCFKALDDLNGQGLYKSGTDCGRIRMVVPSRSRHVLLAAEQIAWLFELEGRKCSGSQPVEESTITISQTLTDGVDLELSETL